MSFKLFWLLVWHIFEQDWANDDDGSKQCITNSVSWAVQEVLANEKAQASNPANEEVDLDELMDVSALWDLFLIISTMRCYASLLSLCQTDLLPLCRIQS